MLRCERFISREIDGRYRVDIRFPRIVYSWIAILRSTDFSLRIWIGKADEGIN